MAAEVVLKVDNLAKTFRKPFSGKKVNAVKGVSFTVKKGQIFGFLGPNGAGKTTTIKMLTGLIAPTSGRATLLGYEVPSSDAMGRVGFLPENPYVYPYLTPREFELLNLLASNRGRVLSRAEILSHFYSDDPDGAGDSNIVNVYIRFLRKKIDEGYWPRLLLTRRRQGYMMRGGKA